jgi:hypothetical protein
MTIKQHGGIFGRNPTFNDLNSTLITSSGNITTSTGNFVVGTSGKGVDFSATSGTGTSEILSDYEQGSWTPDLEGTSSDPTYNSTTFYTKVGNLVTLSGKIAFTAAGSGSYRLKHSSLPFTAAAGRVNGTFSILDSGTAWYAGVLRGDGVNIVFITTANVEFTNTAPFTVASGDELNFTMTYRTS